MSDVVNVGTLPDDGTGDPFRDAYIAINEALAPLLLHAIDRANPHAVTARQVGAYTKVETDELLRAALLGLPTLPNVAAAISTAIGALSLGSAASKNVGTSAGNVPVLDAQSKLLASILPALAITDVFPVASQAEMLALTAERGDVAVRSDLNKSFILRTEPATALGNWTELLTPTDQVTSVAGLTGAISAVALTAALLAFVGDTGTGGGKGLVPAPAAGDAAAGKFLSADGTFKAPSVAASATYPVSGMRTVSGADTVVAGDLGRVLNLTGSFTLSATAAATLGNKFYFWARKMDGGGVVTFDPAGTETISGLSAINIYQEAFLVWTDGANWFAQGRQRGWISVGETAITTATANADFVTGFTDPEIRDVEFEFANITPSASGVLSGYVLKSGTYQTSGYVQSPQRIQGTSITGSNAVGAFDLTIAATGDRNSGRVRLTNIRNTTAVAQLALWDLGAFPSAATLLGRGYQSTNAAIDGFRLSFAAPNIQPGATIHQRLFRP